MASENILNGTVVRVDTGNRTMIIGGVIFVQVTPPTPPPTSSAQPVVFIAT
jgi:hypothetical protein